MLADKPVSVDWRRRVAQAARAQWGGREAYPWAVVVRKSTRFVSTAGDPTEHSLGDLDKLERLIGDALAIDQTGKGLGAGVIVDDSQIVCWVSDKLAFAENPTDASMLASQGVMVEVWAAPYRSGPDAAAMATLFSAELSGGLVLAMTRTAEISGAWR